MSKDSDLDLKKRSGHDLRAQVAARSGAATAPVSSRQQRLDAYREVIVRRQRDFVETGTALGLIAKENLFKEAGFVSFEAMVVGEFDMSTSTAYRLVDAARVVTILSQVGTVETKIRNQTQALALAPLGKDREAMVLVLTAAEARGRITADLLADVRVELYPHTKVIEGEVVPERAALEGVPPNSQETSPGTAVPVDGAEGTAGIRGLAVPSDSPNTAAADADTRAADGEQSRASSARSSAAGADVADQSAPAVNPQDRRDAIPGETGDSAAVESPGPSAPSGVFGADGTTEPEEPQPPVPPATGDVDGQTPVGMPASAPPTWLQAISGVTAAVYDLVMEDPDEVAAAVDIDLAAALGESTSALLTWFKAMQDAIAANEAG